MSKDEFIRIDRIVPEIPAAGQKIKLVIDTDTANEIDDLYAIALALAFPERFDIKGICCAHYNNGSPGAGPGSIKASMELAGELMRIAGMAGRFPILAGAEPMAYFGFASDSEGVEFIIEQARQCTETEPLWIVVLGAATTTASAVLNAVRDGLLSRVRVVFHARSDFTWPERSVQFNVKGDIHAARTLLATPIPLVWFDTGTHLRIPYALSESTLAKINPLGEYLHRYRDKQTWFAANSKGFFDMGDIAALLKPDLCSAEIVKAPAMDEYMFFNSHNGLGKMLRIYDIDNDGVWNLLFSGLRSMTFAGSE